MKSSPNSDAWGTANRGMTISLAGNLGYGVQDTVHRLDDPSDSRWSLPRLENAIQTAMWKTLIAAAALLGALYGGNIMWMFKADADAHTPLGSVGALRAAVGYYVQKHGKPPERFSQLVPDFINVVPRVKLPGRGATDAVEPYGREACEAMDANMKPALNKETLRNTGRWGYIVDPGGPCHGAVFIDSTDPQERVQPYYTY